MAIQEIMNLWNYSFCTQKEQLFMQNTDFDTNYYRLFLPNVGISSRLFSPSLCHSARKSANKFFSPMFVAGFGPDLQGGVGQSEWRWPIRQEAFHLRVWLQV